MSLGQETPAPQRAVADVPLRGVRPNIVQSIRAFRVQELQDAAQGLGQHFLYANLANAQTKQDVLDLIGQQFMLSMHVGKNFDALYDSMTDPLHKSGPQLVLSWCWSTFRPMPGSTRKPASSCWTFSGTWPIIGGIGKFRFGVSILFRSPFCTHQPSRTGERGKRDRDWQPHRLRH